MERLSNLPIVAQLIMGKSGFKSWYVGSRGSRSVVRGWLKQTASL